MGSCCSKKVCQDVYVEMLRRLNVKPTDKPDSASTTRRSDEFKKIGAEKGDLPKLSTSYVTVEQLRLYDDSHWKTRAVHRFNEVLLGQGVEDIGILNGVGAGWVPSVLTVTSNQQDLNPASNAVLRRCDYRFWLLYMCEFYHVLSVLEDAGLLRGTSWERLLLKEEDLKKCLKTLIADFKQAFLSDQGPGDAFRPLTSVTPASLLRETSNFLGTHPLGEGERKCIPLLMFVRWLVLRLVNALRSEEDSYSFFATTDAVEEETVKESSQVSLTWSEIFEKKVNPLRGLLKNTKNSTQLEKLFVDWTNGTRRLSQTHAATNCYEHFDMFELFPDKEVHDTLVGTAFRSVLLASGRELSEEEIPNYRITSVTDFGEFLKAYLEVLELYHRVVAHDGVLRDADPAYGELPPGVKKESLAHVLPKMNVKDVMTELAAKLKDRNEELKVIPFDVLACAMIQKLFARVQPKREIHDLFLVLGLGDDQTRASLLNVLKDNGCSTSLEPADVFDVIKKKIELPLYCESSDLACICAREQCVSESAPSSISEFNAAENNPQLLRVLYSIYGTFVTVRMLEKHAIPSMVVDKMTPPKGLNASTPVSLSVRAEVLREVASVLGVSIIGEKFEDENGNITDDSSNTVSELVQYVTHLYVADRAEQWRQRALQHLREAWSLYGSESEKQKVIFGILSGNGAREVRVCMNAKSEVPYTPFDDLYNKYDSDLVHLLSPEEFRALCFKATRASVRNSEKNDVCLTAEDLPKLMCYIMGYLQVVAFFGGHPHGGAAELTREEVWPLFSREFSIPMDRTSFDASFDALAGQGNLTVTRDALAEWYALLAMQQVNLAEMLRIWLEEIRETFPIRATRDDRAIRAQIAKELRGADGYVPTTAVSAMLSKRYMIERVLPLELGSAFIPMSVGQTNGLLSRWDLHNSEIHNTDIRFLFLFIYTYIDVYLRASHLLETTRESLPQSEFQLRSSPELHNGLMALLNGKGFDESLFLTNFMKNDRQPCTVTRMATEAACASVSAAFQHFCEHFRRKGGGNSFWDRLRARLPMEDNPVHRLERQRLFECLDTQGRQLLTISDLMWGMVGVLGLQEFRQDLQPILFRAFFATKELTFDKQEIVYLTGGCEQFITAPEFCAFLYYVFAYFQLYYMFDILCADGGETSKEVSPSAFTAAKSTLKEWGARVDDAEALFASVNSRCKAGGPMYFAGFAEWASQHHLSPEGYSHDEAFEEVC